MPFPDARFAQLKTGQKTAALPAAASGAEV